MSLSRKPRVAVIGAGPSGLVSAKSVAEVGLEPFVLEKANTVGGLWRSNTGSAWSSMRTNLSHFSCMFSDFPWDKETEDFPTQNEMADYLSRYAKHFDIEKYIHCNATVTSVNKNAENKWQIQWTENDETKSDTFDFVIVATGIFSKPYIPEFKGLDEFQKTKTVIHSSEFKSPEAFKDQRVVTIGGAFSSAEIAASIATTAKQVMNVMNRPYWVLPRHLSNQQSPANGTLPIDLFFYARKPRPVNISSSGSTFTMNKYFNALAGNDQSDVDVNLTMDLESKEPGRVIISDNYLNEVKANHISVKKAKIKAFDKDGIIFEDGSRIDTDAVVFGTGYQLSMPYFDKTILDQLNFIQEDQLQPMLLYKCTLHPDLQNIAFVGMYRGPYFAIMELQARWTSMIFSQEVPQPTRETMLEGIEEELKIRNQQPRPQFPHGNYVQFADALAKEIHVLPDFDTLKQNNVEIYQLLSEAPVIPPHYRFFGPHNNSTIALEQSQLASKAAKYF